MSVPPNNRNRKFVDFLRDNRPAAPNPKADLDLQLMEKLSQEPREKARLHFDYRWGIYSAIAAGCLLSAASLSFKKPQLAVEAIELEEFLVNSWNETLKARSLEILEEPEMDWLLPKLQPAHESAEGSSGSSLEQASPQPALSVSAR
ncbi:hypothetical protein [Myxosarcina sp. GI1(2024)]